MIDVSDYSMQLGISWDEAPEWAGRLVELNRRDAAFVDTGYIRALLDTEDGNHVAAKQHWSQTKVLPYTSELVAAEAVRQLAKKKRVDQGWRWQRVEEIKSIVVDDERIVVCSPPREVIDDAFRNLLAWHRALHRLDLCDALTMVVLDAMRHRRVFGFDAHLRSMGAALEPM